MKKAMFALCLIVLVAPSLSAQPAIYNDDQSVLRSSGTIVTVLVSTYTPTLVDTPQLSGSFAVEVQNRDASNKVCCSFDAVFSTVTASAQAHGCREIASGGAWSVSRWFQNLRLYCQSLGISASSPVAVTQGK